jgi:hypothetical protein
MGCGAEPRWQDETTSPIDRQARTHATMMQDQHAAPGGGLGPGVRTEHLAGLSWGRDASGRLYGDDPVAPLDDESVA